ncbi:MAG: hypothetical protein ACKVQR_23990 [Aquabacterium sp.]
MKPIAAVSIGLSGVLVGLAAGRLAWPSADELLGRLTRQGQVVRVSPFGSGTLDPNQPTKRCMPGEGGDSSEPNPINRHCSVEVVPVPAYGSKSCRITPPPTVINHKGQKVIWAMAGPDKADFVFDGANAIDFQGYNKVDGDPQGKPLFKDCTNDGSSYWCRSDATVTQAKMLAYNIHVKHRTKDIRCSLDPIIINRD